MKQNKNTYFGARHLQLSKCLFLIGVIEMKRDLEVIREILSKVEAYEDKEVESSEAYHLSELINQGLINATQTMSDGRIKYYYGLTLSWEGHELLAAISNSYVWESIKDKLGEHDLTVNDVPIEVIKKLSENIMLDMLGG